MDENVTVYLPDNSIKKGYLNIFREMADEVRNGRWLTWQLFVRDFKGFYKQSVLGVLWVLLIPLVTLGTFVLLNRAGVFNAGNISVPYPLYALLGLSFWQIFASGIQSTTNSVVGAGSMISKIKFPRESLIFSSMGQALVAFLIQTALTIALFVYYGIIPMWTAVFVPLALIPIVLITIGLGFVLSIANGVVRDIGRSIGIIITFLMLITPILYASPTEGFLGFLTTYNPLFYLTTFPRDLMLTGQLLHPIGYAVSVAISLIVFFGCWVLFHLTETRIAERI